MEEPTEAELFADLMEYRVALEVLRVFDVGYVVNISRSHSTEFPTLFYKIAINKLGVWDVASDQCTTLQQAAEQARDRAYAMMARNDELVEKATAAISKIVSEQTEAEFMSVLKLRTLTGVK